MHPVNGPVTSPYGYRVHPIYGYYCAARRHRLRRRLRAAAVRRGRRQGHAAYFSAVYGNRIIIDNGYARGDGLGTIYNHATSYRRRRRSTSSAAR